VTWYVVVTACLQHWKGIKEFAVPSSEAFQLWTEFGGSSNSSSFCPLTMRDLTAKGVLELSHMVMKFKDTEFSLYNYRVIHYYGLFCTALGTKTVTTVPGDYN
jgi:hypothetical protein